MSILEEELQESPWRRARMFTPETMSGSSHGLSINPSDFERRRVTVEGKKIRLSQNEFQLLRVLLQHVGETVTYQQLSDEAFGIDRERCSHHLRMYVRLLRRRIEPDPTAPRYIVTDRNNGYRLMMEDPSFSLAQWDRP